MPIIGAEVGHHLGRKSLLVELWVLGKRKLDEGELRQHRIERASRADHHGRPLGVIWGERRVEYAVERIGIERLCVRFAQHLRASGLGRTNGFGEQTTWQARVVGEVYTRACVG